MLQDALLLVGGFAFLLVGADHLVRGSAALAKRLGLPTILIGLTVVAFGTSAPELVVNVLAAWRGDTALAMGNVVGSNLANVLLILGASAVMVPLAVERSTIWKGIPFSLLAALLLLILGSDVRLNGQETNMLTRSDGLTLFAFFVIFLYYLYGIAKENHHRSFFRASERASHANTALAILAGAFGVALGAHFVVDGAVDLAKTFGISDHLIGFTVVAVGTSLPELATSIVAARKGQPDIAVGNIVGSNIFNVFFILATTAIIAPIPYDERTFQSLGFVVLSSALLFFSLFVGRRHVVDRWQGVGFVLLYVIFVGISIAAG